jgi:DNA mismatch repair protein MutS
LGFCFFDIFDVKDWRKMDKQAEEYKRLKENYPEEILFYQVGIFYKVMFEDARKIADIAGLKLMVSGEVSNPIEVCGFPKSGLDKYVGKLLRKDFSVAICNQVQDGKGQIRREVSEVVRSKKL